MGCGQAKNFGKILKCINYGNVGTYQAAGIAGPGFGTIEYCINYGTIKARNRANGIQGGSTIDVSNVISNCYNIGQINGPSYNSYGIAAANTGLIKNSYNVGKGTGDNYKIVNKNTGTIENSYYLNETLDDGTILTEEFMKSDNFLNMLGSEYVKDNSGKNNGYPMLKWQK